MFTPITIDRPRNLRYGMRALSLVEKKQKKNLASIDFENLTIEESMTIVWAGLVHEDPNLTVDALIDLIDDCGVRMDTIINAMSEAITDAFGESSEKNPKTAVVVE